MERRLKHWASPEFRGRTHQTRPSAPFLPPSFPARRKRRGRRRRVRNDRDGTSRRKRRLFSSVLVSSFPNRKRNSRFGFSCKFVATSQSRLRRASSPGREPFPLRRGINPSVTFGDSSLYTREPWGSGYRNKLLPGVISGRGAYLWVRRFSM